jgi:hypothetical protein
MKTIRFTLYLSALATLTVFGCDASSPTDPDAAISTGRAEALVPLTEALADPDPYARARSLGALLPTLGSDFVLEARRTLDDFPADLGAAEFELILRFWAAHEPKQAAEWSLGDGAPPQFQNLAVAMTVEIWAEADPESAVAGVGAANFSADLDLARITEKAVVQGWFKTDRAGLQKFIYQLPGGKTRQRFIATYLAALTGAEGSEAAIRWAESITEDNVRYKRAVYRQLVVGLARSNIAAAERFCDQHCDGPHGMGMRGILARRRLMGGEDGRIVIEWLAQVPEGDAVQQENWSHAVWLTYALWAKSDQHAALNWMREKLAVEEPEPWLRVLYGEYARQLAADSPEEALQWAERVEEPAARERTMVRIARYWLTQDQVAADAWLNHSSLSKAAQIQARDLTQPIILPNLVGQ